MISHIGKALHLLGLHKAEVSILLVNDRKMKELNLRYRGLDKTTDVLSFPQMDNPPLPPFIKGGRGGIMNSECLTADIVLGDIVINLHKAKRQAVEHDLTFNEELSWLLIHGILHLIGYEHKKGRYLKNKMGRKEKELFDVINLP
ncbi:MAG: rRNA maturation RNase YbeY [Nitrospirae bacterium RBG_13_41_22]|nr:MAG: rRNA maturation RNase YbeY [Nitrospirae bacterium RBG_13_41_22]